MGLYLRDQTTSPKLLCFLHKYDDLGWILTNAVDVSFRSDTLLRKLALPTVRSDGRFPKEIKFRMLERTMESLYDQPVQGISWPFPKHLAGIA